MLSIEHYRRRCCSSPAHRRPSARAITITVIVERTIIVGALHYSSVVMLLLWRTPSISTITQHNSLKPTNAYQIPTIARAHVFTKTSAALLIICTAIFNKTECVHFNVFKLFLFKFCVVF